MFEQIEQMRDKRSGQENGFTEPFNPLCDTGRGDIHLFLARQSIVNIINSYQDPYDFIREPVQNGVDSIEERLIRDSLFNSLNRGRFIPELEIIIDLPGNHLTLIDNGLGMNREDCMRMFVPSYSAKARLEDEIRQRTRGYKGVGATYMAYGYNFIQVSTKGIDGFFSFKFEGGRDWALSKDNLPAPIAVPAEEECEVFHHNERGTAIKLRLDESSNPQSLSRLGNDAKKWEVILRTKTAAGPVCLRRHEAGFENARVHITLIDQKGQTRSRIIPFRYFYPHEIKNFDFLDLKSFFLENPECSNPSRKYRNKDAIYRDWTKDELFNPKTGLLDEQEFPILSASDPAVYAFNAYSSRMFEEISKAVVNDERMKPFKAGARIATRNTVEGKIISLEPRFDASARERIFMLVDLDDVRSDLGRKGFDPSLEDEVRALGLLIIKYFNRHRRIFLRAQDVEAGQSSRLLTVSKLIKEAERRESSSPLSCGISCSVTPEDEDEVIGLFYELLGRKVLRGYRMTGCFRKALYDGIFRFELNQDRRGSIFDAARNPLGVPASVFGKSKKIEYPLACLEFKVTLENLLRDIESPESMKRFEDIVLAVVWDKGKNFSGDYHIEDLMKRAHPTGRELHGVTHLLQRQGSSNGHYIQVIMLKSIVDLVKKGKVKVGSTA